MGCRPGLRTRLVLHGMVLVAVLLMATTAHAYDASDTLAAIDQASAQTGISAGWLTRVVTCETGGTLDPEAVGDHGTSLGPAQLHRGGGELPRFFARFGSDADPFDPYAAVLFMAEEFVSGRASAWSCK